MTDINDDHIENLRRISYSNECYYSLTTEEPCVHFGNKTTNFYVSNSLFHKMKKVEVAREKIEYDTFDFVY